MEREEIFAAAEQSEFNRIKACCEVIPFKACSNDVWKGDIVAFVSELERRGAFGWQQAASWLCQHYHEHSNIASLVKAMREAASDRTKDK